MDETVQRIGDTVPDFRLPDFRRPDFRRPDFRLPEAELADAEGAGRCLDDALQGRRGAVIVFWSGICSHCQRYDGWLSGFAERRPELALRVVASRQNEDAAAVARVAEERGLRFPILIDADRRTARAFRVEQTPRAFLVDAERRLLYRGAVDNFTYPRDPRHEPYLDDAIDDFLAGRPIRRQETPSFGCPIESVYYRV